MSKTLHALLISLLLCSTSAVAAETSYNLGVQAWRIKDYAQARKHWEQSLAEGGPDEALNNLGFLYYYGLGGESHPGKAVDLWRKGAALAVSEAQSHLGDAYLEGRGVEPSRAKAYAWFQCAIATATKRIAVDEMEKTIAQDAQASLSKLEPLLSSSELIEGKRFAAELIGKYSQRLSTVD